MSKQLPWPTSTSTAQPTYGSYICATVWKARVCGHCPTESRRQSAATPSHSQSTVRETSRSKSTATYSITCTSLQTRSTNTAPRQKKYARQAEKAADSCTSGRVYTGFRATPSASNPARPSTSTAERAYSDN